MHWLTLLILAVVNLIIIAVGAVIFRVFEDQYAIDQLNDIEQMKRNFLERYQGIDIEELERLLVVYSSAARYGHIASTASSAGVTGVTGAKANATRDNIRSKWDYTRSCQFTLTVVSTIGYGSQSPSTTGGRMFCVVYAVFGIPPFMALIAGFGENLKDFLSDLAERTSSRSRSVKCRRITFMLLVGLLGLLAFIILPAILFHKVEGWSYSDAIYYTVISITTIGFGDLVTNASDLNDAARVVYRIFHIAWLFFGLAWLSTIISSRQEVVVQFFNKHAKILAPKCTTDTRSSNSSGWEAGVAPSSTASLSHNKMADDDEDDDVINKKQTTPL